MEVNTITAEEINARTAELKKISDYCEPEWDDEDNCFRGSVWAPNSQTDGYDVYEAETEKTLQSLRKALPGWVVDYTGSGNTDADGTCTEDVTLTPPEAR